MDYPIPFGDYLLLNRIEIGGMAVVFLARHKKTQVLKAIKCLLPRLAENPRYCEMFAGEARMAIQMNHENIVKTEVHGRYKGQHYIVMEFLHGVMMRNVVKHFATQRRTMQIPQAVYLMRYLLEAVDYASNLQDANGNALDLVNCDISPSNIMLCFDGRLKLIDFGIAQTTQEYQAQIGRVKGKLSYMSPEQVRGHSLDHRSDLFSCGVVFYQLLTSQSPYHSPSEFQTMEKVRSADFRPLSELNRQVPREIERMVMRLLAQDLEVRYQKADEVLDDLNEFIASKNWVFTQKNLAQFLQSNFETEFQKIEQVSSGNSDDSEIQNEKFIDEKALITQITSGQSHPRGIIKSWMIPMSGLLLLLMLLAWWLYV